MNNIPVKIFINNKFEKKESYNEIYTLYDLLDKLSLDYNEIDFGKPIENEHSFTFICSLPETYTKLIQDYLNENGSTVQYKRNTPFNVVLKENKNKIHIKFKKI